MNIYRGFDIDKMKDGTWRVSLGIAVMAKGLASEEEAMSWVDRWKRENKR